MPFIIYCTPPYAFICNGYCYLKRNLRDKIMLEKILPKSYKCLLHSCKFYY